MSRERVAIKRHAWRIRCRKCGKKATVYSEGVLGWFELDGWYLKDTEECPECAGKAGHVFTLGLPMPFIHESEKERIKK